MEVQYITHSGDDLLVVNAARVSFDKESSYASEVTQGMEGHQETKVLQEKDRRLLRYLAEHRHWTPFSHPQITLRVKAPVFVRTQCFKHKVGFTENEVSRRYVDSDPELFHPLSWRAAPDNGAKQGSSDKTIEHLYQYTTDDGKAVSISISKAVRSLYDHALELYSELIVEGVAPEQARMVLPQSMYTEWFWTGSLAAYARFYGLRSDSHAQKEIQDVAGMVGDIIQPLFPESWKVLTG